jgi:hypothetical protein
VRQRKNSGVSWAPWNWASIRSRHSFAASACIWPRWQAGFDPFAATLDDLGDPLLRIADDLRSVPGIARGVGEARQLGTGSALLQSRISM